IVSRLFQSAWQFTDVLPEVLWRGYAFVDPPPGALKVLFFAVAALGLVASAWPRREPGEASFWLLIWAAAIVSSAFVYADDGLRVMAVTYPLLCTFVALGFTAAAVAVTRADAAAARLV